jgi:hypothetical protein
MEFVQSGSQKDCPLEKISTNEVYTYHFIHIYIINSLYHSLQDRSWKDMATIKWRFTSTCFPWPVNLPSLFSGKLLWNPLIFLSDMTTVLLPYPPCQMLLPWLIRRQALASKSNWACRPGLETEKSRSKGHSDGKLFTGGVSTRSMSHDLYIYINNSIIINIEDTCYNVYQYIPR